VDFDGALHAPEKCGNRGVGGDQARDRMATLGDEDFFSTALDLIEEMKTPRLELAGQIIL
jgi:hypothetical protein